MTLWARLLRPWDFQARILESVAISFSMGSSPPQGSNSCFLCVLHCNWILYPPESSEKPLTYLSLTVFGWTVRTVGGEDGGAKTATAYGEGATLFTSPGLEWNVLGKLVSGSCGGGSRFC